MEIILKKKNERKVLKQAIKKFLSRNEKDTRVGLPRTVYLQDEKGNLIGEKNQKL